MPRSPVKRTLHELAYYPPHSPRAGDVHYRVFNRARHHLIDVLNVGCWVGGATKKDDLGSLPAHHPCAGAKQLEAHHHIAEFAALTEVDWQKVAADFPQLGIDSDEKFLEV